MSALRISLDLFVDLITLCLHRVKVWSEVLEVESSVTEMSFYEV